LLSSLRLPPPSTLFPYTTLFRSRSALLLARRQGPHDARARSLRVGRRRGHELGAASGRRGGALELSVQAGEAPQLRGLREPDHRSEEHTSELQSRENLVCRLLLE